MLLKWELNLYDVLYLDQGCGDMAMDIVVDGQLIDGMELFYDEEEDVFRFSDAVLSSEQFFNRVFADVKDIFSFDIGVFKKVTRYTEISSPDSLNYLSWDREL